MPAGIYVRSATHKRNMSLALKGRVPGMLGKHHSELTKQRISQANKGQIPWLKGLHLSEKTRHKMGKRTKR